MSTAAAVKDCLQIRELADAQRQDWAPILWAWIQEFPDAHFDDLHPATDAETWMKEMWSRRLFIAWHGGSPCGVIGFEATDQRTGLLRGICFAKRVHGTGVPQRALVALLAKLKDEGMDKVTALYYASNAVVRSFLRECGFQDEGRLAKQVLKGGQPVDVWVVSTFL